MPPSRAVGVFAASRFVTFVIFVATPWIATVVIFVATQAS
jgi:hypothetical protein